MELENKIHYVAFDVYGTLPDTNFVASAIRTMLNTDSEGSKAISSLWRWYQLDFDNALRTIQTSSQLLNIKLIVFSNGTSSMVSAALEASEISPMNPEAFLADNVRCNKPSPAIYEVLISHMNIEEVPPAASQNVWLISENPLTLLKLAAGLRAIWVDRSSSGWVGQLSPEGPELGPSRIVRGLDMIPDFVRRFA